MSTETDTPAATPEQALQILREDRRQRAAAFSHDVREAQLKHGCVFSVVPDAEGRPLLVVHAVDPGVELEPHQLLNTDDPAPST